MRGLFPFSFRPARSRCRLLIGGPLAAVFVASILGVARGGRGPWLHLQYRWHALVRTPCRPEDKNPHFQTQSQLHANRIDPFGTAGVGAADGGVRVVDHEDMVNPAAIREFLRRSAQRYELPALRVEADGLQCCWGQAEKAVVSFSTEIEKLSTLPLPASGRPSQSDEGGSTTITITIDTARGSESLRRLKQVNGREGSVVAVDNNGDTILDTDPLFNNGEDPLFTVLSDYDWRDALKYEVPLTPDAASSPLSELVWNRYSQFGAPESVVAVQRRVEAARVLLEFGASPTGNAPKINLRSTARSSSSDSGSPRKKRMDTPLRLAWRWDVTLPAIEGLYGVHAYDLIRAQAGLAADLLLFGADFCDLFVQPGMTRPAGYADHHSDSCGMLMDGVRVLDWIRTCGHEDRIPGRRCVKGVFLERLRGVRELLDARMVEVREWSLTCSAQAASFRALRATSKQFLDKPSPRPGRTRSSSIISTSTQQENVNEKSKVVTDEALSIFGSHLLTDCNAWGHDQELPLGDHSMNSFGRSRSLNDYSTSTHAALAATEGRVKVPGVVLAHLRRVARLLHEQWVQEVLGGERELHPSKISVIKANLKTNLCAADRRLEFEFFLRTLAGERVMRVLQRLWATSPRPHREYFDLVEALAELTKLAELGLEANQFHVQMCRELGVHRFVDVVALLAAGVREGEVEDGASDDDLRTFFSSSDGVDVDTEAEEVD